MIRNGLLLFTAISLASCAPSALDDEAGDSTPQLEAAEVDFGYGPVEIVYEVIDGMAYFEDDIILGPVEEIRNGEFRLRPRNAAPNDGPVAAGAILKSAAWPEGRIPYVIDGVFYPGGTMFTKIMDAIDHWNQNTLVKLVPAQSGEYHVRFVSNTSGCTARYGNISNQEKQTINLSPFCATGTIIHEIGHTVGFFHEHTRADRDTFVTVNWANIWLDEQGKFETHGGEPGGEDIGPYDFDSVMHYRSYSSKFAINDNYPILVKAGCSPWTVPLPSSCKIDKQSVLSDWDKRTATEQVVGIPNDAFRLENEWTGRCLRPRNASQSIGATVDMASCSNTGSRRWHAFTRSGMDGHVLVNQLSKLCLERASTGNGLVQMPCTGADAQRFHFDSGSGSYERIRLDDTQQCLRDYNGRAILSSSCSNTPTRRWFRRDS